MTAVDLDDPPSTVAVGAYTDRTSGLASSDDDCVPTRPDWPQQEFLAWLDATKRRLGIVSDNQLAMHLGIGHTLISGWRNNRQRPSFETLNLIAHVLGDDPRPLWVLAGLVTPGEVGLLDDVQPTQPIELPAAVVELLDLLDDPRLDAGAREQLLGTVRVLVAGTQAGLSGEPPARVVSPRRPGRKAS
jgi:transcriptional regulator with XRE-family HTH domain